MYSGLEDMPYNASKLDQAPRDIMNNPEALGTFSRVMGDLNGDSILCMP